MMPLSSSARGKSQEQGLNTTTISASLLSPCAQIRPSWSEFACKRQLPSPRQRPCGNACDAWRCRGPHRRSSSPASRNRLRWPMQRRPGRLEAGNTRVPGVSPKPRGRHDPRAKSCIDSRAIQKDEIVAAENIHAERMGDNGRQPIEMLSHVRRQRVNEDSDRRRKAKHDGCLHKATPAVHREARAARRSVPQDSAEAGEGSCRRPSPIRSRALLAWP